MVRDKSQGSGGLFESNYDSPQTTFRCVEIIHQNMQQFSFLPKVVSPKKQSSLLSMTEIGLFTGVKTLLTLVSHALIW